MATADVDLPATCPPELGITTALAAAQIVVTQIIRLRASNRITRGPDNLRVLEIEDLPHHQQAMNSARPSSPWPRP
jgi:hypothetical protein